MLELRLVASSFAVVMLTAGCFAPPSATQRLADSAIDMNTAMQFGRMDIAMDYVGAVARKEFVHDHSGWGKRVRIVDVEFAGVRSKEKDEADVVINVAWQRLNDPTMLETSVLQHWKDARGSWTMTSETTEGDEGLFGSANDDKAAKAKASSAIEVPPPRAGMAESGSYPSRTLSDE